MKELLGQFSGLSAVALRFMETEFGCRRTEGFSQFDGYPGLCSLRVSDFSQIPGIFSYVVRYSDREAVFDLTYGDRELIIEPLIIYPVHNLRFYPTELLSAASIPQEDDGLSGGAWVQSVDYIERIVAAFATSLRRHWSFFRQPSIEVLDRALIQRGRRMRFAQDEQRRKDRERACIQASAAFHSGDHRKAVTLLMPFLTDPDFPKTSRKLYDLAGKHNQRTGA